KFCRMRFFAESEWATVLISSIKSANEAYRHAGWESIEMLCEKSSAGRLVTSVSNRCIGLGLKTRVTSESPRIPDSDQALLEDRNHRCGSARAQYGCGV